MTKRILWFATVPALLLAGAAIAQYPIMNAVADRVVQKYTSSSCGQLWQEKAQKQGQPLPEREQKAVQLLREDPQMRAAFINKVAAPMANKMFECGMIP
jgi:transposase-like protein